MNDLTTKFILGTGKLPITTKRKKNFLTTTTECECKNSYKVKHIYLWNEMFDYPKITKCDFGVVRALTQIHPHLK